MQVEEIKIKVPWGHIAAKWWGPKNIRPILAIHGWQDNAGTFDKLIPLLPTHLSYLAIDMPGHGLSSRYPEGILYGHFDMLVILNIIANELKWDKVSLMGHSMGALLTFIFSVCFPQKVDMAIALDALKPHIHSTGAVIDSFEFRVKGFMLADERNRHGTDPPTYPYDELVEKLSEATYNSVTREAAPFLLDRGIRKSSLNPDRYYYTRDSRVKFLNYTTVSQEVCLEMASRIKCPYFFIKATNSPYYEDKKYFEETIAVLEKNPDFLLQFVDGTHHVHLTEPTKISGMLTEFINKFRPAELPSKL